MWSLHFQLSAVWVGIQLASAMSATATSTCDAVTMVRFKQARASSGEALCAVTPTPNEAVSTNKLECSRECAARGALCSGGFNYKHQEELCELFIGSPTAFIFQVQHGCEYYMVCVFLLYVHCVRNTTF